MKKLISLILALVLSLTAVSVFAEIGSSPSAMKDIIADATGTNIEVNEDALEQSVEFGNEQYEKMAEFAENETGNLEYYTGDEDEVVFQPSQEAAADPLKNNQIVKVENLAIVPLPLTNVNEQSAKNDGHVKITVNDIPTAVGLNLAPNETIVAFFIYQGTDGKTHYAQIQYVPVLDADGNPVLDKDGKPLYDFIIPLEIALAAEDLTQATVNFEKITYKI